MPRAVPRPGLLTLGTVQLGAAYGRIFPSEPPDDAGADAILDAAWTAGIRSFDSAPAYGLAERRLGDWIDRRGHAPHLITKLPALPDREIDAGLTAAAALDASCAALKRSSIDAYLLHRSRDVSRPGLIDVLNAVVRAGRVGAWGLSTYTPEEFARALDLPGLGCIEAPISIFDRRLAQGGLLARAAGQGVQVFARSLFLQGAVFLDAASAPRWLAGLRPALRRLDGLARDTGAPRGALALAAVRDLPAVTTMVVGAQTPEQIREIAVWAAWVAAPATRAALDEIASDIQIEALDPRSWKADG